MKFIVKLFILSLFSSTIFAGGTDFNPFSGSKTLALNGMYFAGSDNSFSFNPSSILYQEGFNFNFSLVDKIGQQEFLSPTNGLHRSYSEDNFSYAAGVSWKYNNLALALNYFPLIDFNVSWPYAILRERNNTKIVKAFDMLTSLKVNSVSPTAAYDFGLLKVGVSANIYLMKFKTDFALTNNRWISGAGEPGYQFRYEEDGIGYGATGGATLQVSDALRFGAFIKTPFKVDLSGTGKSQMLAELDTAAAEVDLGGTYEIPLTAGLGVMYNFSSSLIINADLSYYLWESTQKELDYEIQNTDWKNNLTGSDPVTGLNVHKLALDLQNSFNAGIGLEYFPGSSMFFRAGYRYSQSPFSDETYNMLFPTVDTHNFSFGIGYFEENYSIDATLLYSTGTSTEINSISVPVNSGKYDSATFIPALTLTYKL